MTNFEFYTKNAVRLGELIEKAVDDALEAKGCSLDLKYPEKLSNADDTRMVTWASWRSQMDRKAQTGGRLVPSANEDQI